MSQGDQSAGVRAIRRAAGTNPAGRFESEKSEAVVGADQSKATLRSSAPMSPVPHLLAGGLTIGGTGYAAASVSAFQFPHFAALGAAIMALPFVAAFAEFGIAI